MASAGEGATTKWSRYTVTEREKELLDQTTGEGLAHAVEVLKAQKRTESRERTLAEIQAGIPRGRPRSACSPVPCARPARRRIRIRVGSRPRRPSRRPARAPTASGAPEIDRSPPRGDFAGDERGADALQPTTEGRQGRPRGRRPPGEVGGLSQEQTEVVRMANSSMKIEDLQREQMRRLIREHIEDEPDRPRYRFHAHASRPGTSGTKPDRLVHTDSGDPRRRGAAVAQPRPLTRPRVAAQHAARPAAIRRPAPTGSAAQPNA